MTTSIKFNTQTGYIQFKTINNLIFCEAEIEKIYFTAMLFMSIKLKVPELNNVAVKELSFVNHERSLTKPLRGNSLNEI